MNESRINSFLNSGICLVVAGVITTALSYYFYQTGSYTADSFRGLLTAEGLTSPTGILSWFANLLTVGANTALIALINKRHTFIREYTHIHATAYLILTLSIPSLSVGICPANICTLLFLVATATLFNGYQKKHYRSYIFLICLLLSAGSMISYAFIPFAVMFLIGFFQMQLMSAKGLTAMIIGLFTPYWIILGLGICNLEQLQFPAISFATEQYLAIVKSPFMLHVALSVICGATFGIANVFQLMSYKLQLRSFNGFFTIVALLSTALLFIDIANIGTYLAAINVCLAIQMAHFFTIHSFQKGYILLLLLYVANIACSTTFSILELF